MGIWQHRLSLAKQGWTSELGISPGGYSDRDTFGVGFWAKTWIWQGRVAEICLHAHGTWRAGEDVRPVLELISARVMDAFERAKSEFADTVPCQTTAGSNGIVLASSGFRIEEWRTSAPVNNPPPQLNIIDDAPESGLYADAVQAMGCIPHTRYTDRINPYAVPRRLRDPEPAVWQFQVGHVIHRIGDMRIKADDFRQGDIAVRALSEDMAAGLVACSAGRAKRLHADYSPGGRMEGQCPPGHHLWVPEPIAPVADGEEDDLSP